MKKIYASAFVSAILLWLGWPPQGIAPLLLIAFVPLLGAVDAIQATSVKKQGRRIFWLSFFVFFAWNTASVYWVYNSLHSVMDWWVAGLVSLVPFGLAPLLMATAIRLYAALKSRVSTRFAYVGLVCFWIGLEYLNQSWDLAFPWMTLGNGFASMPAIVQWYEYTGIYGGSLWILVSNILIHEAWHSNNLRQNKKPVVFALVLAVLLPAGVSLLIYFTYREKVNPANVVVVQPNIDPYNKFDARGTYQQIETLKRLSDSVAQKNTEFFIWPETAISSVSEEERIRGNVYFMQAQQFLLPYKNASLVSGIESYSLYDSARTATARYHPEIGRYADTFNAAILVENSARVQFYHKSKLVPGVEQTPFAAALIVLKPLFARFGGTTGGYGRQEKPSVLYAQSGIGTAPVICFDSLWGDWVGGAVNEGAQFIAIMTNDGWWGNTAGKDQHFDYARLRAIETRRWVARSANTGISGFINQRGDVVSRSQWWVPTALKADINLNEERTMYVRVGDLLARLASLGAIAFVVFLVVKRRAPKRVTSRA